MDRLILWGTGKYAEKVYETLILAKCEIVGIVDSDVDKQGMLWKEKYRIFSPEQILNKSVDYILVSATIGERLIRRKVNELGINNRKLIFFWSDDCSNYSFINKYAWENQLLKIEVSKYKLRAENAKFEYGKSLINIKSASELLNRIIEKKDSLCRFGDGEFDIILNESRSWFQECDVEMGKKLKKVLQDNNDKIVIAIADNYGNLDRYTETAADTIRRYMTREKRKKHMELLDAEKTYYDAYVSRPYIMYKDKNKNMKEIISLYRKVFDKRNILLVEGENTKTGWKNDLLSNAKSIKRILCPDMNAYAYYNEIYESVVRNVKKDDLVLITLGATATILAYDLSIAGIQAIDFGQLDNEYEWYLMQTDDREVIKGKSVSELLWYKFPHEKIIDKEFEKQVVCRIQKKDFIN